MAPMNDAKQPSPSSPKASSFMNISEATDDTDKIMLVNAYSDDAFILFLFSGSPRLFLRAMFGIRFYVKCQPDDKSENSLVSC